MNRLQRMENLSAYIDGELTAEEVRLLFAWCESHPEDASEYEALAEVVRQIRDLPEIEPPADLQDRILRAVAANEPVTATREQALEWLDEYLDGELSEPRKQVVDHFLQTDPEFADLAELHVAMLTSLRALDEAEPPADLKSRIEAQIAAESVRAVARPTIRPTRLAAPKPWVVALAAAAVIMAALGLGALRGGPDEPQIADVAPLAEPVTPEGAPADPAQMVESVEPTTEIAPLNDGTPQLPFDNADEPVVVIESGAPNAATDDASRAVRPAVKPQGTIAEQRRETRSEAPRRATPRSSQPAPRTTPSKPQTAPRPSSSESKRAPSLNPASPAASSGGGQLTQPSRGSNGTGPEFVTGSGNDSVLGGDNLGTEGNLRQGNESPSRGQVDPTRRSEAPPF